MRINTRTPFGCLAVTVLLVGCATSRYTVNAKIWDLENLTKGKEGNYFPEMHDASLGVNNKFVGAASESRFGIVVSGGGTRSASASLGQMRVLQQLQWIDEADYVGLISGGAWGVMPYLFFQPSAFSYPEPVCTKAAKNMNEGNECPRITPSITDAEEMFLGDYLPPAELTDEKIKCIEQFSDSSFCHEKRFAKTIASADVKSSLWKAYLTGKTDESFASVLASIFLEPYDLHDKDFFTWSTGDRDKILGDNQTSNIQKHKLHPGLSSDGIAIARRSAETRSGPYPIIGTTLMVNESGDPFDHYPIEITPNYVGVRKRSSYLAPDPSSRSDDADPFFVELNAASVDCGSGSNINKEEVQADSGGNEGAEGQVAIKRSLSVCVGGGYVEPIAYDSWFPDRFLTVGQERQPFVLKNQRNAFSLSDVLASTGAAPQASMYKTGNFFGKLTRNLGLPEFNYWNVSTSFDYKSALNVYKPAGVIEEPHGDGGHMDNIGIMPLLGRGVENILVFVNTMTAFESDPDTQHAKIYPNFTSFFDLPGRFSTYRDVFRKYPHNIVFEGDKYHELISAFRDLKENQPDKPLVHCNTYAVKGNAYWDISGGYNANICWVYLDRNEYWIDQLPDGGELRRRITEFRRPFTNFPHYGTFLDNWRFGDGGIIGDDGLIDEVIDYTEPQVNALAGLAGWSLMSECQQIGEHLQLDTSNCEAN